ncbi:glycosyl transferase-like protein [Dinothrombium tinctorium]|uniref:UDP-glucuronosyltransferase n=1 Tax=Dinothrombium tinctorium TaxID=1965070 RepID=A0A3S4QXB2_9ACAR|nr:glycosyl transferase-like protein [Dinothrombium tinctorium]RWS11509.1 glycosyl transferase-like protein [Dinothrombium tinctorium]
MNGTGHVNTVLGIANALKSRNHRVVFATDKSWQGKFENMGIEEELIDLEFSIIKEFFELANALYDKHLEIVSKVKPNIIIVDNVVPFPGLLAANKLILYVCSANPLIAIDDKRLPPCLLGLPLEDKHEWDKQREILNECRKPLWFEMNKKLEEYNIPALREYRIQHVSTNLNIYVYPKLLMDDYLRLCPLKDEWHGLDHSIRPSQEQFDLRPNFKKEHEKLIYLSMGSFASNLFGLMSHLIKLLAKCKHKIIIVTGQNHDKYELPENMWGGPFLPQLQILPLVDLVITHGGNNTFIESLYFGKPMIIIPLFGDQPDNAQRAVDAKIGVRFDPFEVEESELLNAIESLLSDKEVAERVRKISTQLRASNSMDVLVPKIELIAKQPKIPTVELLFSVSL